MKSVAYILIEMMYIDKKPEISSRLLEISMSELVIVKSEWSYLGDKPINIEFVEDEEFKFTSNDDTPRTFISEFPEDINYIEGEVVENGKECGTFILRKITGVSVDDPF